MASQYPPKKNAAFTLYFTLYKNDGTIIANPGTITKKRSIDGAAVGDIAASVTEEDTTYGQCSVILSADDMNGDAIWIYIVDNTSGCVPFTCTLYTAAQTLDEVKTETASILEDTGTTLPAQIAGLPLTPSEGTTITPATEGTDGEAIGRVPPHAEIFIYLGSSLEYKEDADADGDFSLKLPTGSTWTLWARAAGYETTEAEVTT